MALNQKFVSPTGAGAHDGSSAGNAWTLAEAIAAYAAGDCLNTIFGTYANTTTSRTFGTNGTTTAPVLIRGYNATIGDCDLDPTLARPEITFTSGVLTVSGQHHILSSLNISAARNGAAFIASAGMFKAKRSRFINVNANSAALAMTISGTSNVIDDCYVSADVTANQCINGTGNTILLNRCVVVGGIVNYAASNTATLMKCLLRNAAGDAVTMLGNGGMINMYGNAVRNAGRDGVRLGGAAATPGWSTILNNVFAVIAGVGINNVAAAGNTNFVYRGGNRHYANTGGDEAGFGDSPAFGILTGGSDPHVSSTNLSLAVGDAARAETFAFENFTTTTTYADRGPVQHADAGTSGYARSRSVNA